ncbi:peptidoglycan/LPS O-acetylase OafA/YrhL [Agromyces sp. 3263]|uniref:acyltransferase family protein n=1 Tax=Agromyces sp. 3263 TaxID=2817750 RepID=UPI00285CADB2|nr:acyltransferase [Agromyces sp. 3263]MDR6904643.1 peptidoglycan/LPS O-acetylase OafA/YrhL [Agromyces sp. 3263]
MTSTETAGLLPEKVRWAAPGSISEALAGHRNSLGVIRLVLATMVIFDHAFPLGGFGPNPSLGWSRGQESIGGFAVAGFFAISGYLIAKSGLNSDVVQFLWRRVLRIFPAFWLVLLVGAAIVGPIAWTVSGRSLSSYLTFGPGGPVAYVISNADLTMRQWGIHDIFIETPYGQVVDGSVFNGSLWTLVYEFGCYLIIALFVLFGILRRARLVVVGVTVFYFIMEIVSIVAPGTAGQVFPNFGDGYTLKLGLIFLIGSCIALYSKEIVFHDGLALLSMVVVIATLRTGGWTVIGYPAFAYVLLWFAARLPKSMQWIGAKNDYSYGMYVYGFLVQQSTAALGLYKLGYLPWVAITIAIAAGCAWVSWHAVEKHALALKDWGPGRGVRYWYESFLGWVRAIRGRRARPAADAGAKPDLDVG